MKLIWETENVYLVIAYSALRGVSLYQIAHLTLPFLSNKNYLCFNDCCLLKVSSTLQKATKANVLLYVSIV